MSAILTATGCVLSSFLVAGCGATGPRGTCRPDPSDALLADGEVRLEKTLHALGALEVETYSFEDAPVHPIDTCIHSDSDVVERNLAWKLTLGKTFAGQDKVAEQRYYTLLQEGTPAALLPLVHLRSYYYEALRRCVLALVHRAPQEAKEESNISILSTANFEAETTQGVVLVDFMTHWCWPCKRIAPDLEKLARDYRGKFKVGWLDVDRNMAMIQKFNLKTFPTLIVMKNGKEAARRSDAHVQAELKEWVERVLHDPGGA